MSSGHCKTTELVNLQKLLGAFTRSSQSTFECGMGWVHESPSLTEKLWRVDDFWGGAESVCFKDIVPGRLTTLQCVVTHPHIHE